jgi:hypothetical protein
MASRHGNKRERAAEALAVGLSLRKTADRCKVPLRTLARWHAKDEEFRARIRKLREALLDKAAGRLAAVGGRAVRVLAGLLSSRSEKTRLAAAVKALDLAAKAHELGEQARQLAELERWREEVEARQKGTVP